MLLEIENVCKVYKGGVRANEDISLSVDEGEIFGLLGPNGAGKSTLVHQIIGLAVPTSGMITIDGINAVTRPDYARQVCSFQAQVQVPIAGLTAMQAIELVGRIRGGKKKQVHKRALELIDLLDITEWQNKMGVAFSGGVRRLVAFCMAVVVPGRIVILDEPTNDVDPLRRRLLWQEVQKLSQNGSAVLLVTHNVLEAERAVDRLAIIDKGRVVSMGTAASMKEDDIEGMRLEVVLEPDREITQLPDYLTQLTRTNRRIITRLVKENVSIAIEWANRLKENGIIEEYSLGPTTLENVYVRMVSQADETKSNGGDD